VSVLKDLCSRVRRWLALSAIFNLLAASAALALGAVLLDATLDLSENVRAVAPLGLAVIAGSYFGFSLWRMRTVTERRVAWQFEQANPAIGTRLTNAVELAHKSGASAVEEFLRREAVQLGRVCAAALRAWSVVRRRVRVSLAAGFMACLAWMLLASVSMELLRAVWPRFLDPRGDHPPYSRLRIDVVPEAAAVLYGGQIEVRATTSGRPVDKLWLVARSGTNETRAIMFLAPDHSFFQTLANLREAAEYFVTDGSARTRRFPISIRYTPQITMAEVRADFPDYTGKAPRTFKLAEPQALPADTRLTLRVASNRPLKGGELTLTPVLGGEVRRIELQTESSDELRGTSNDPPTDPRTGHPSSRINDDSSRAVLGAFTLTEPVIVNVSVRDVDGLSSVEPRQGRFNVLPDERPRLFVLEPGRDAVATPDIRVPVRVQATDDYGVTRVIWLRGHNRSIVRPFQMRVTLKGGPQSVEAEGAFDLGPLGVRPGDVIDYYFEAADNDPKGPNVTLSRLYRLEIISEDQYQEILRRMAAQRALFEPYFKLGSWLRRLAERARDLDQKARSASEAEQQELARQANALAKELADYETELGNLMRQTMMFDVEQAFRETLVAQHEQLRQAQRQFSEQTAGGEFTPGLFAELSRQLSELARTEEQEIGEPARQIAAVAHLLARADRFVRLAQEQESIARLLQRFAEKAGGLTRLEQMEVQELMHHQRRVQDGLRNLLETLPELAARLPDNPAYDALRGDVNAFIEAVAEAKIERDMDAALHVLAQQDTMTGHALARLAANKMDKLIARCRGSDGMPGTAEQCLRFRPSVQEAMGGTLGQILAAMGAGDGADGQDGYSMFSNNVGLYGPAVELAGAQAGGGRDAGGSSGSRVERVAGDAEDPGLTVPDAPGRVRLQPDAKFPLRYRDLVGEYFRAIAESETEEGGRR
jgi:hypothetical protein